VLLVSLLNHSDWVGGTLIGALAGSFIPFETEGVGFALTALFVVLMIEQILKKKKPGVFIISAAAAVLGAFFLPSRLALLGAMAVSLACVQLMERLRHD
jgi:4-azaleucine resistance transporter AzlC